MSLKVCVDSSVVVKWFKKGEEHEGEALRLRDESLSSKTYPIMCEWVYLEVVRALVKAGYPKGKIVEAYKILKEMAELGFIKTVPVQELLEKAKELEIELNLYASDAVNLATAIINSENMLTEDKHLLQDNVRIYVENLGLKIMSLKNLTLR
ncbi:type II toxin-antitoxin system VapC family toxin [Candidatus Bathyarchaeota archaeon]|nr:type II toxin-antitoxin system VapC family toxin [Candidatus Bathyarchaeota archaeon]